MFGHCCPFPIQVETLPDTLAGKDMLRRGKTGSGKTVAFCIPMVARLGGELAPQIAVAMRPLAEAMKLRVTTIFGAVSQTRQVQALRDGVEIVVATPGRLEDLTKPAPAEHHQRGVAGRNRGTSTGANVQRKRAHRSDGARPARDSAGRKARPGRSSSGQPSASARRSHQRTR